jgi:hypothetical protein
MSKKIPIMFDEEYLIYNAEKNEFAIWCINSKVNDPMAASDTVTIITVNERDYNFVTPLRLFMRIYNGSNGWIMLGEL